MKEEPFIKRFQIEELFGIYNVDIPFCNNINIFIGENGLGKTTILNCINYVLQGDEDNLYHIKFKKIILTFKDGDSIEINHDELYTTENNVRRGGFFENEERFIIKMVKDLYKEYKASTSNMNEDEICFSILRRVRLKVGGSSRIIDFDRIKEIIKEVNDENKWLNKIQKQVKNNIIYLPTYRRIEEDFNKFINNSEYRHRDSVMKKIDNLQFGMDDVEDLIESTCDQLRNATNEGFKEMTSNLLKNYISMLKNKETKPKISKPKIEEAKLRIVFERLADKIDDDVKEAIIQLLDKKDNISDFEYSYLVNIISNLLEIYEKTKSTDESLDKFTSVCNEYLENNTFRYNPFKVECKLIQEYGGETLAFKNLSSGEKQIVSLFSKLYLSKDSKNIVLFDEPELSLSIVWQSKLLPDIIESNKCGFMMVITHSPFIFDNEYKKYTKDIKEYITPIKQKTSLEDE